MSTRWSVRACALNRSLVRSAWRVSRRPEPVGSDDEEVQVSAYGGKRFGAHAAQLASGALFGYGTDLLRHGERDLPQPGVIIGGNSYVMVEPAITGGERYREEEPGDHGVAMV